MLTENKKVPDRVSPDTRLHGEYIREWKCFKKVCRLSLDGAWDLYHEARLHDRDPAWKMMEQNEFKNQFINKGFRVVLELNGMVFAIYNHDGQYSLWVSKKEDFIARFNTYNDYRLLMKKTAFDYAPWVEG